MKTFCFAFVLWGLVQGAWAAQDGSSNSTTKESSGYRSAPSFVQLIPVVGASRFTVGEEIKTESGPGSSYGAFVDFGSYDFKLEIGALGSTIVSGENEPTSFDITYWSAPVFLKYHLLGNSHTGLFLKVGAVPVFIENKDTPPIFAAGGLGLALGLGPSHSFIVDVSYNQQVSGTDEVVPGNLIGLTALAGISWRL